MPKNISPKPISNRLNKSIPPTANIAIPHPNGIGSSVGLLVVPYCIEVGFVVDGEYSVSFVLPVFSFSFNSLPQLWQNTASFGFDEPHFGHLLKVAIFKSFSPHSLQNIASSGF